MASNSNYTVKSRNEMKTMDVFFVPDNLVEEVILTRKEYERQQLRKLKEESKEEEGVSENKENNKKKRKAADDGSSAKKSKQLDDLELALAALENDEVEKVAVKQPTTLFDEASDVAAEKMYSFEMKKAANKSPIVKAKKPTNNTTSLKRISLAKIDEEPERDKETPYTFRKRVIKDIKKIQKILENSDDEESDFSPSGSDFSVDSSGSSDEEVEEEKEEEVKVKKSKKNQKLQSYFEMQSSKKVSSGNTLKKLSNPKMTREKVDELFKEMKVGEAHKPHMIQLFRNNLAMFERWEFVLRHNYNVLIYGVGSKKDVMEKFLLRFTNRHPVITVNGFFPSITVKDVLEKICNVLRLEASSIDVIESIEAKLKDFDVEIIVGINNIDGVMLRNRKSQETLARLAKLPQIRLIASVDHCNAPLLWDQCLVTDFNWAWFDCTTFLPYADETLYEGNLLLHPSGQLTLASLRSVFNSLPKNSRAIFLILVREQLEADKNFSGVSFRELYHEGRRQLLVSADAALRLQLKEFIDHAIVKQKRSPEGEERYLISMDNSILRQFLEEQDNT